LRRLLLQNEHFTFAKLAQFVEEFLPESFWEEEFDDAKPESLKAWVGPDDSGQAREHIERDPGKIEDYEKIDRLRLRQVLRAMYDARSALVHSGEPLPSTIVVGLGNRIPAEAAQELLRTALQGVTQDRVPTLLAIERLVAYSLTEFLSRSGKGDSQSDASDA
jgi:hypothetical protein